MNIISIKSSVRKTHSEHRRLVHVWTEFPLFFNMINAYYFVILNIVERYCHCTCLLIERMATDDNISWGMNFASRVNSHGYEGGGYYFRDKPRKCDRCVGWKSWSGWPRSSYITEEKRGKSPHWMDHNVLMKLSPLKSAEPL